MPVHHLPVPRVANQLSRRRHSRARPMPTTRDLRSHQHRSAVGDATNLCRDRVDAEGPAKPSGKEFGDQRPRVRGNHLEVHLPATDRRVLERDRGCAAQDGIRHSERQARHSLPEQPQRTDKAVSPKSVIVSHSVSLHMERIARESPICKRQQKSSQLGDPVNDGTVQTISLYTSTFIGSVLIRGIGGCEVLG